MIEETTEEPEFKSAADILGMSDIETSILYVPEWKTNVRVRMLTAAEAVKLGSGARLTAVEVVALCVVDENGNRLFSVKQVEQLKQKSLKAIMHVQKYVMKINGLRDDEAKNV